MTVVDTTPEWQDPNPAQPQRSRTRAVLGGTAAALALTVAATLGGTLALAGNSVPGSDEIVLQSLDSVGSDPFTASVASYSVGVSDQVAGRVATAAFDSGRGVQAVDGTTPALYGGTNDDASCDAAALANFLAQDASKSAAWASAFGITAPSIPHYLNTLTPVVLTRDTWVTNHFFVDRVATPYQSVLQAGTAVLVDAAGVPRVRCTCGNPLAPPASEPLSRFAPVGDTWPAFEKGGVTAVNYSTPVPAGQPVSTAANNTAVDSFTLIDLVTAGTLERAAGGTVDVSPLPVLSTPLPDPVAINLPIRTVSAPAEGRNILPGAETASADPATSKKAVTPASAARPVVGVATSKPAEVAAPATATPASPKLPPATTPRPPSTETRSRPAESATSSTTVESSGTTTVAPTSNTPSSTSSSTPPVATVFTGNPDSRVRSFVLTPRIECTVEDPEPGSVEAVVECIDTELDSVMTHRLTAEDLEAPAVERSTVDGVWRVQFVDDTRPTVVLSAARTAS